MSNLSHIIRSFNRFELKYLITLKQAEQFKLALQPYLLVDEHGKSNGRYALTSLYYDSPDFRCYWEKIDGIRYRRKLRIRYYDSGLPLLDSAPVFVEVKQRIDRITQKRRVILPYKEALLLCNERALPETYAPDDKAVIEEIHTYLWQYNLYPASIIRYERQAFIGGDAEIGLRVTFDDKLSYQTEQLLLHEAPNNVPLLPADQVIMEIKVNERIPYWLTELVAEHNLKLIRVSKYCHSIEVSNLFPSISSRRSISI